MDDESQGKFVPAALNPAGSRESSPLTAACSLPFQTATQDVVDPRRLGQQNSGFSDDEIADIICILYPTSENARRAVVELERENPKHLISQPPDSGFNVKYLLNDDPARFSLATPVSAQHAIVLRLSVDTKDPAQGFTFGRNQARCDICLANDPLKRLSNIHFRIYINEYGVLMLEDTSTNGTVVDERILQKAKAKADRSETKRTLSNGSEIKIMLHSPSYDIVFLVQVPKREGRHEEAFRQNLYQYRQRTQALDDDRTQTIVPGDNGPPNLFPRHFQAPNQPQQRKTSSENGTTQIGIAEERLSREWNGSEQYNRIGQIGKGAFATVYKVTSKYDGKPYAAKELDKRRFIKNGVLDQKVENEMKIMRRVTHPNIVRYVDHFEWDNRLLIIVMEYIPLGDLSGYVHKYGPLDENMGIEVTKQLAGALGYLHQNNITHRDVKPDNILIQARDPLNVKLTDFGLSKMIDNEQTFLRTFCGTLLYCAPEVYSEFGDYNQFGQRRPRRHPRPNPRGQRYDHAVDLWSLGGVLHYALTGKPPFPVQSGTSYAELLHTIMTQDLGLNPLMAAGVSEDGIDCLSWMLCRWPEERATVEDVLDHRWLHAEEETPAAQDRSSDELGQRASQLSLEDSNEGWIPPSQGDVIDEEDEYMALAGASDGTWSQRETENNTFGRHMQPPRLFGEVNVSAIGSSGVIPEDRLNLPVPASPGALGELEDSFSSNDSADPRQVPLGRQSQVLLGINETAHQANLAKPAPLDLSISQAPGALRSPLDNIKGKSLLRSNTDLTSSKRKPPSLDASDELDGRLALGKASFKRLRSESHIFDTLDSDDGLDDYALIASVPPISRMESGRQMDIPVSKTTFWAANDRKTWHLYYPEMTQLQHDAFLAAAAARGEEFSPGGSPLWDLAMTHFPPAAGAADSSNESASNIYMKRPAARAASEGDGTLPSEPGSQPPGTAGVIVPVSTPLPDRRLAASLQSAPGSVVENITVLVREAFTSFGRADSNTQVYTPRTEVKVPKFAFKLLLWKSGYDPCRQFRPWNSRDAESYHFYISTKATNGIRVNEQLIQSHDPKVPTGPSRNWVRLQDGDIVAIWGDENQQTKLLFQCAWGGSMRPRSASIASAACLVSEEDAARLDDACSRAERRLPRMLEDEKLHL
ncbi:serine/threonine protein kinase, partial [Magnaporthiopsis poae ATCC 64411]